MKNVDEIDTSMLPSGSWPFACDQLIPCLDVPGQSCACKNNFDSENFAIVYNLNQAGIKKS